MTAFTHLQLKSRLRIGRPVSRRSLLIVMFIIVALASGALPSARGVSCGIKAQRDQSRVMVGWGQS